MIDHISVGVSNLERSAKFYEAALARSRLHASRHAAAHWSASARTHPEFWINLREGMSRVALR